MIRSDRHARRLRYAATVVGLLVTLGSAEAQDERGRPKPAPIPVNRPTNLPNAPEAGRLAATPQTPSRKTVTMPVEAPHDLPVATRARMHQCGSEWQRQKMSGEATDKIWRVFAQSCLVSQTP